MEASEEEINALNPRDIKRVDFYPNGRPDYPEADVVLDYILKERDYAGAVAFNWETATEPSLRQRSRNGSNTSKTNRSLPSLSRTNIPMRVITTKTTR